MEHTGKLYCYVDESGQDTGGRFFTVSALVTEAERDVLRSALEAIEERSGKGVVKWRKSSHPHRTVYIEALARLEALRHSLFVATYRNSTEYLAHTADAIAKALRHKHGSRAVIYVDALRETEQPKLKRQLRPSVRIPTQVRGVRREENNAFIRIVDAICGLVRDAEEGNAWAQRMTHSLKERDILEQL